MGTSENSKKSDASLMAGMWSTADLSHAATIKYMRLRASHLVSRATKGSLYHPLDGVHRMRAFRLPQPSPTASASGSKTLTLYAGVMPRAVASTAPPLLASETVNVTAPLS